MYRTVMRMVGIIALGAAVIAMMGCSSTSSYQMQPGERTLGSKGDVEVAVDDNMNRTVHLEVAGLPNPNDLHQQKSTFTVWVFPDHEEIDPVNAGQLRIDEDGAGHMHFTTPFRTFDLVITAEPSGTQPKPSDEMVLHQTIGD